MINEYPNGVIAQLLQAIIGQINFDGTPTSNIGDILLSILEQTPYDKEPKSVLAELFLKLKDKLEGRAFTPYDKEPKSAIAEILLSILNETEYDKEPNSRIAELLLELKAELESYAELTASGAIANFTTSVVKPLVNLTAYFKATQEAGTPTPQSPKAISGVSAVNVVHCHKNLYQYDESKVSTGTTTTDTTRAYYPLGFKGVTSLTFSANLKSGSSVTASDYLNIGRLRKSDGLIEILTQFITPSGITTRTLSISSDDDIVLVSLENPTIIKSILSRYDIQVEVGSNASEFEPYNGNNYEIVFPPKSETAPYFEGLLNGTFDFVDLGSLDWTLTAGTRFASGEISSVIKIPENTSIKANMIVSAIYTVETAGHVVGDATLYDRCIAISSFNGNIFITNSAYSDATAFGNSLNGIYLIYELATPKTSTITPEQLATLKRAFAGIYYGGYVSQDKDGKRELVVKHSYFAFSGKENWQTSSNFFYLSAGTLEETPKQANAIGSNGLTINPMANKQIRVYPSYGINSQYISMESSLANLQGYFSNGIGFVYELDEPIVIDLADGEPITAFNGVNNIYNDSGDTSVTYLAKVADNLNATAKLRAEVKAQKIKAKEELKEDVKKLEPVIDSDETKRGA